MMHCATSQKVMSSICSGVTGILYFHDPFSHTLALGLTRPPTEMSTRNFSWGKDGWCIGLTTLPPSSADCLEIWEPQSPGTLWACNRPEHGLLYLYLCIFTCNLNCTVMKSTR